MKTNRKHRYEFMANSVYTLDQRIRSAHAVGVERLIAEDSAVSTTGKWFNLDDAQIEEIQTAAAATRASQLKLLQVSLPHYCKFSEETAGRRKALAAALAELDETGDHKRYRRNRKQVLVALNELEVQRLQEWQQAIAVPRDRYHQDLTRLTALCTELKIWPSWFPWAGPWIGATGAVFDYSES